MMNSLSGIIVLLLAVPSTVWATCSPNNNQCEELSGSCSTTVDNFFVALGPEATMGEIQSAAKANAKLFKYGKYCGATNKCPGENNGQANNAPEPCNEIDRGCKEHDTCLDNKGRNGSEGVDFPERCECDIGLVMAMIPNTPIPGIGHGPSEQLCDADFYAFGFPETAVIALPFCQTLLHPDSGCDIDPTTVGFFCNYLIQNFL